MVVGPHWQLWSAFRSNCRLAHHARREARDAHTRAMNHSNNRDRTSNSRATVFGMVHIQGVLTAVKNVGGSHGHKSEFEMSSPRPFRIRLLSCSFDPMGLFWPTHMVSLVFLRTPTINVFPYRFIVSVRSVASSKDLSLERSRLIFINSSPSKCVCWCWSFSSFTGIFDWLWLSVCNKN